MNWFKIAYNIIAAIAVCAGTHYGGSLFGIPLPGTADLGLGIVACVLANQAGLHQAKP